MRLQRALPLPLPAGGPTALRCAALAAHVARGIVYLPTLAAAPRFESALLAAYEYYVESAAGGSVNEPYCPNCLYCTRTRARVLVRQVCLSTVSPEALC